ncbi:hypothetical protein LCGC14_0601000 [marine sediment metagenome]|uniref:Uncharacterized protein n=1 Tax=marine sediment metagenome TaxID=412755 RepID=A0A0F9RFC2_9ZZZZ
MKNESRRVYVANYLEGRCKCPDDSSSCTWCQIYYSPDVVFNEFDENVHDSEEDLSYSEADFGDQG